MWVLPAERLWCCLLSQNKRQCNPSLVSGGRVMPLRGLDFLVIVELWRCSVIFEVGKALCVVLVTLQWIPRRWRWADAWERKFWSCRWIFFWGETVLPAVWWRAVRRGIVGEAGKETSEVVENDCWCEVVRVINDRVRDGKRKGLLAGKVWLVVDTVIWTWKRRED